MNAKEREILHGLVLSAEDVRNDHFHSLESMDQEDREYSRNLNDECDRWLKKARMLLVEAYAKPKKLAPRRK